jgi:hypothetical protein
MVRPFAANCATTRHQGCQMFYFQTKNINLGKFRSVFAMKDVGKFDGDLLYCTYCLFVYFMAIFYTNIHILWLFWYIFPFWYVVPRKIWQLVMSLHFEEHLHRKIGNAILCNDPELALKRHFMYYPGADSTIVSYYATSSLLLCENKNIFFYNEKTS